MNSASRLADKRVLNNKEMEIRGMDENTVAVGKDIDLETVILQNVDLAESIGAFREVAEQFQQLMMMYSCAIREVRTKLEVLNDELSMRNARNPIEMIKARVKKPKSIVEKLQRRGLPLSIESMESNLDDIAGVRVICSFVDDIYEISRMLERQDDVTIIAIKDYIKAPKENGYRSYHMIVEVPVFFSSSKKNIRVEVQIRTIAMDCWASIEHELKYKHDIANPELMQQELKHCSDQIASTDLSLSTLKELILTPNADPDANSNTSAGAEKPVASDCRGIPLG